MKRYIRTKNGEVFDTEVNGAWEQNDGTIGIPTIHGIVVTPKAFIVKEADTIEELCDCFVCIGSWHCVWDKETHKGITLDGIKLSYSLDNFKIYGAIWTDKGLIYVAKLNEKGELELL